MHYTLINILIVTKNISNATSKDRSQMTKIIYRKDELQSHLWKYRTELPT